MKSPSMPTPPDAMAQALLEQLKDIATPTPVGIWPPAPGWWVVGALLFAALGLLLWHFLRVRRRRRQARLDALRELEAYHSQWRADSNSAAYASAVRGLLRRIAIHALGRERAARQTGSEFIEELEQLSSSALSSQSGRVLAELSYQRDAEFDVERLHAEILSFIEGFEVPRHA